MLKLLPFSSGQTDAGSSDEPPGLDGVPDGTTVLIVYLYNPQNWYDLTTQQPTRIQAIAATTRADLEAVEFFTSKPLFGFGRAILTREQPRDLYDCYHLLSKGVEVDRDLIRDKLDYYDLVYEPDTVVEAARMLEENWEALDVVTYSSLPPFEVTFSSLENALG